MRVAVMGRSIRPNASGVGRHAANLVGALAEILPPRALTVFLTRDAPNRLSANAQEIRAPFPTPNEYARAFWEQTVVPAQLRSLQVDVYHSPNYILPALLTLPSVVTIHDLVFLSAQLHRLTSHVYLSALTTLALRRATAIIAVSEWTRRAIEARYPRTAGRIEVIYQGVDPGLRRPDAASLQSFRARHQVSYPYVLFVGTLEPRKNLIRLLAAFERAVTAARLPHHLVLIGATGWKTAALDRALRTSPLAERIHLPGYVPDRDLPYWYAGAALFAYPSLEEGFGLPPLEAMACGAPVLTSNCSALPEVVGDAAYLIDPTDTEAIARAIAEILSDPRLAERLSQAGPRRARCFTWSDAARRHLALYERIASGGRR